MIKVDRSNIIDHLIEYFTADPAYYLLVCDCGFAKVDRLQELFPGRVINCGIMEQGTVGIAAGMAQAGLKPIIFSIASFIVFRALEQIKIDLVQMNRKVKIIGQGSGDYFKSLGRCHCIGDDDLKALNLVGMPVYLGDNFKEWIEADEPGYIKL
jgi:transketolase